MWGVDIYRVHTPSVCHPDNESETDEDKGNVWTLRNDTGRYDTCVIPNWIFPSKKIFAEDFHFNFAPKKHKAVSLRAESLPGSRQSLESLSDVADNWGVMRRLLFSAKHGKSSNQGSVSLLNQPSLLRVLQPPAEFKSSAGQLIILREDNDERNKRSAAYT